MNSFLVFFVNSFFIFPEGGRIGRLTKSKENMSQKLQSQKLAAISSTPKISNDILLNLHTDPKIDGDFSKFQQTRILNYPENIVVEILKKLHKLKI